MKKTICCLLLCITLFSFGAFAQEDPIVYDEPINFSYTTGLPGNVNNRIVAVQLDNSPDARPIKGIAEADIVYEIELYKNGYTRYTAIFNDSIPEEVEAVRSARIVNADFSQEYGGLLVHYGGQNYEGTNVFDYMDKNQIMHADGLKLHTGFYRDTNRSAPYNVVCRLKERYETTDWSNYTPRTPLKFSEDAYSVGANTATEFGIQYHSTYYGVSYKYAPEEGVYYRYYLGAPFKDGHTKEQITCSNVIIHYISYVWHASDAPEVQTTGSNKCEYFIDGTHFTGTWERNSIAESTTYYDENGNEVIFKPGKTYIQTLADTREVNIVE